MNLPLLRNLKKKDLTGKRVLLRLDLNGPIKDGKLLDDFRVKKALPSIVFLGDRGAQIIILIHHTDKTQTLKPVAECLNNFVETSFVSDIFDKNNFEKIYKEHPSSVIVCENIRFHEGEEHNDIKFAKRIASLGDLYVNDAFSVSHRKHASIVSLPTLLPSYAGLLFEEEVIQLAVAFEPPHPFLFILGGGKAQKKFHLIEKFIDNADTIFVAGTLSSIFFKKQGYEIGESSFEEMKSNVASLLKNKKIVLPQDVAVLNKEKYILKKPQNVLPHEKILDIGPQSISTLRELTREAHFILWNGPLGDYLIDGFEKGSVNLINMLAESKARVVAGGGDTVTIISQEKMLYAFDFVSTGGGAMLEFLAERTLPGMEALRLESEQA